jgi:hypothetical protein
MKMNQLYTLLLSGCLGWAHAGAPMQKQPPPKNDSPPLPLAGKVTETMDASGYTYILIQSGTKATWAASKQFEVKVGEEVNIAQAWMMKDFESKTLNRKFETIWFASAVEVAGRSGQKPASLNPHATGEIPLQAGHSASEKPVASPPKIEKGSIRKAEKGYTVDECYSQKAQLAGKVVRLRGVVVKFNPDIMGKNWAHVQDGTGSGETADLTLTTSETLRVGDTVLLGAKLSTDKDFGYGYKFSVLLEDAKTLR